MSPTVETTPVMGLTPGDLDALVEGLRAYQALHSPPFRRREQREQAVQHLRGLLVVLPRESIAPLVLAVEGPQPPAVRAMQQSIREGSWADTALLHRHWQEVDRDLGRMTVMTPGSDNPAPLFRAG